MRKIQLIGMTLAVVAAMAAMTSVAAAHEFVSTGTGALSLTRNATQKFTTRFGAVECTAMGVTSKVNTTKTTEMHASISYSTCTAIGVAATVSTALYLFLASGETHIKNTITITALGCKLTVLPQSVNTVKYKNTGKELELKPEVTGIAYEGSGSLCNGTGKDGTYTGTSVVALAGQTIEWK